MGWNVWEDIVASFLAANGTTKKKSKIKDIVALDGHRQINRTQKSTKNTRVQQGRDRKGGSTGVERGGGCDLIVLGTIKLGRGVKTKIIFRVY